MTRAGDRLEAARHQRARLLAALVTGNPEPLPGWLRPVAVGTVGTGLGVGAVVAAGLLTR